MKKLVLCSLVLLFAVPAFAQSVLFESYAPTKMELLYLEFDVASNSLLLNRNIRTLFFIDGKTDTVRANIYVPEDMDESTIEEIKKIVGYKIDDIFAKYEWSIDLDTKIIVKKLKK